MNTIFKLSGDNLEYMGESFAKINHGFLAQEAFEYMEFASFVEQEHEQELADKYDEGKAEGYKQGGMDAIDKIQYDLDNYLDSILDHSEHELTEEFKDELYKGIAKIISEAKDFS